MTSSWFLFFRYRNDARSNKHQIRTYVHLPCVHIQKCHILHTDTIFSITTVFNYDLWGHETVTGLMWVATQEGRECCLKRMKRRAVKKFVYCWTLRKTNNLVTCAQHLCVQNPYSPCLESYSGTRKLPAATSLGNKKNMKCDVNSTNFWNATG